MIDVGFVTLKVEEDGRVGYVPVRGLVNVSEYISKIDDVVRLSRDSPASQLFAYLPEGLENVEVGDVVVVAYVGGSAFVLAKVKRYEKAKLYVKPLEDTIRKILSSTKVRLRSAHNFLNNLLDKLVVKSNTAVVFYTMKQRKGRSESSRPQVDFVALKYKNQLWMLMDNEGKYFYASYKLDPQYLKAMLATRNTKLTAVMYNDTEKFQLVVGSFYVSYESGKLNIGLKDKEFITFDGQNNVIIKGNLDVDGNLRVGGEAKVREVFEGREVKAMNIQSMQAKLGTADVFSLNNTLINNLPSSSILTIFFTPLNPGSAQPVVYQSPVFTISTSQPSLPNHESEEDVFKLPDNV